MTDSHASQSTEPAIPAAAPATDQVGRQPNTLLGVAGAIGLGLVAAGLYALVAVLSDREFGYLALLIGVAVGFGFTFVGKVKNITVGIIAAVIAALMFIAAVFLAASGIISGEFGVSFFDALDLILQEPVEFAKLYFEEDVMSYVFLLFAIAPAFIVASGIRDQQES